MNREARSKWTIVEHIGVVLGIFTAIVAVAQAIKPIRAATADVAAFLWPGVVAGILGVVTLGLLARLARRERQLRAIKSELRDAHAERDQANSQAQDLGAAAAPGRRDHDARIIEHLVEIMPRSSARFLAEHDFGASWERVHVLPVHIVADEFDDPEHRLLDAKLEALRQTLIQATREFSDTLGQESAPKRGAGELSEPISPLEMDLPPDGEAGERWRTAQARLNEASTRVAEAYDQLLGAAHQRLHL